MDACGGDGWITIQELTEKKLVTHHSVGYLVKEDTTSTTITMSYEQDEENLGAYLVIPNINIINKKTL